MPLVQGPTRSRQFFDWIAPRYKTINARLYRLEWRDLVRSAIEPGRVLDVGVGTGYTTSHLRKVVGIDLSRAMLAGASGYRGDLVQADAGSPPFRPGSFATIVCAGSFYYLADPVRTLRSFHGLLSPSGAVVLISPEAWFLRPLVRVYTLRDYESMAQATDFRVELYESLRGLACLVKFRKWNPARNEDGSARGA
ncbi:MAG TPA: class I SAM-dependent methyltransferase [Thermoplasmata archaeon]|nr:class I SAM-dependent methyltransferase [Thermoplasmata archaeon]